MDQKTFDEYTAKVVAAMLKNAGRSFGVPFFELNELCIELSKRGVKIPD